MASDSDESGIDLTLDDQIPLLRNKFVGLKRKTKQVVALRACFVHAAQLYESQLRAGKRADLATLLAFRLIAYIAQLKASEIDMWLPELERLAAHAARSSSSKSLRKITNIIHGIRDASDFNLALEIFERGQHTNHLLAKILDDENSRLDRIGRLPNANARTSFSIALSLTVMQLQGDHWDFWKQIFQKLANNSFSSWKLLENVALIPDDDWRKGPSPIAGLIEGLEADFLSYATALGERLEFDVPTQHFFTVPIEISQPNLLGATLSQVEDALADVMASPSNGLHDASREVRVLNRVLSKYGNDPQQIEMGFNSVYKGLARQFLSEELPQSEENLALQDALAEGARGIRATHPEVAENRRILNDQAIREMAPEAVELLEDGKPVLEAISDEALADEWAHDIPQLINDATTPLPSGAPPLPGTDETTRIFSRVSKMKLIYDDLTQKGADIFDSDGFKTVKLGLSVGSLLSALVALGLAILGIL